MSDEPAAKSWDAAAGGDLSSGIANTFGFPAEGPDDPRPIVRRLVADLEEFQEIRIGEATILSVMRYEDRVKGGRVVLGTMGLPKFMGPNASFCLWLLCRVCGDTLPDFILTLDARWWLDASPMEREALVYHELCHCEHARDKDGELRFTDEGFPVWGIRGHDIEEFDAVVRRYGAWSPDVQGFVAALRDGKAIG